VCVSKVYIYLGTYEIIFFFKQGTYEYLIIIISLLFRKDYNVTTTTISQLIHVIKIQQYFTFVVEVQHNPLLLLRLETSLDRIRKDYNDIIKKIDYNNILPT